MPVPKIKPPSIQKNKYLIDNEITFNTTGREKGLLAAILFSAALDLHAKCPQIKSSATRFFRSLDISYYPSFSFLFICQILNICPKKIIRRLIELRLLS